MIQTSKRRPSGFSILEVMVVSGLLSIVGLAITSVVTNAGKSQKKLEQKDLQISTASYVRSILSSSVFCTNAFCEGVDATTCASASLTGLPTSAGAPAVQPFSKQIFAIQVGGAAPKNIVKCNRTTDSCNLATSTPATPPPTSPPFGSPAVGANGLYVYGMWIKDIVFQSGVVAPFTSSATLVIQYAIDSKLAVGGQLRETVIPIILEATAGGAITGCKAGSSDSKWLDAATAGDIFYSLGRVGIGTNTPTRQLEILNTGTSTTLGQYNTSIKLTTNTATVSAGSEIVFSGAGGTEGQNIYAAISAPAIENTTGADGDIVFSNKATQAAGVLSERMRINRFGNVGIRTSTPEADLDVVGPDASQANVFVTSHSDTPSDSPVMTFLRARGTSAARTEPQSGDRMMAIVAGNKITRAAWAGMFSLATEDHTPTTQGMNLSFRTVANGSIGGSERMVIAHNGNVGIGVNPTAKLDVDGDIKLTGGNRSLTSDSGQLNLASSGGGSIILNTQASTPRLTINSAGSATFANSLTVTGLTSLSSTLSVTGATTLNSTIGATGMATLSGGVTVTAGGNGLTIPAAGNNRLTGRIDVDGDIYDLTGTHQIRDFSVISTSDRRLKKNVNNLKWQTDLLNAIETYSFNYIKDKKQILHYGMIAQELQKLYPHLIRSDEDGYLSVNYLEMTPILLRGLQESNLRISELESQNKIIQDRLSQLEQKISEIR